MGRDNLLSLSSGLEDGGQVDYLKHTAESGQEALSVGRPVSTTGENRTRPGLVLSIQVRRARELTSEGLQVLR